MPKEFVFHDTHETIMQLTQALSIKARVISAYKKAEMLDEDHAIQLQTEYYDTTKELTALNRKLLCPKCGRVPWNHGPTCEST